MNEQELLEKYSQIPQEIKDTKRWVCYKTEIRENGDETKIPTNAISGGYASTADPATWTSFKLAIKGCVKYGFAGLGFMLGEDTRTGTTYFGVDLDNHVDPVTKVQPYATQEEFLEFAKIFINTLNSYTELSHSEKGIHIICKGKLPGKRNKKKGVEMYDYRRFFTMTGKVINNVPIAERSEEVKPLWEKYLNVEETASAQGSYQSSGSKTIQLNAVAKANGGVSFQEVETIELTQTHNLNDYELIERIRNSQQGSDFMRLYNGDMSAYNNDHSAADMALCKILAFWTGCNPDQMNRIFENSGLMRDKWTRRWGNGTYGSHTIDSAIQSQRDVYNPAPVKEVINVPIKTNNATPVLPQGEMIEFDEKNDPVVKIKQIFKTYTLTDTGNAERFYDYFGEFFRYNATSKSFMFWNGKTWTGDSKVYVKKFADKMIDILKDEIKQTEQKKQDLIKEQMNAGDEAAPIDGAMKDLDALIKAQKENLKRVSNSAGKEAMIKEFQHLHEIAVVADEFDTQAYLLNTDSGVVDLTTGKIMSFDKDLKLSKNTNCMISFEEPKVFLKFLHDIFSRGPGKEQETEDIISTVQLLLGEAATGRTNKDHLTILYGNGSNGKSTFIKTIDTALGDYSKTINSELLLQSKNSSAQSTEFAYAAIAGARFLSMSETNEGEKINDKIVKQLTSGEKISAQYKFGNSFSYEPTFSPWMSTNNLPNIRSKDYGIWRRIFLIPFLNTFTEENKDIHMPEKLKAEMPQILGWIIQGSVKLNNEYKGVVVKPKCLEESLADYKKNMDVVNLYIASNCQNFPGYRTSAKELYQDYKMWALNNNEYAMPESKFKADMQSHGFKIKPDSSHGSVYVGIKLNTDKKAHSFVQDIKDLEEEKGK